MLKVFKNLKIILWAISFLIAPIYKNNSCAVENPTQETYRDIIRKAELLALQKDRTQATQLLISAIKKEEKQTANRLELQKTLDQIASIFFTENAQQVYELGISIKEKDPTGAIDKLNEALRLDPKNFHVAIVLAKIYLSQFECSKAKNQLENAQQVNPYSSELELLFTYQSMCSKKPIAFTIFKKNNVKGNPYQLSWMSLEITNHLNTPNFDNAKVKELASNLLKLDPKYPETYYYNFILEGSKSAAGKTSGEKYIKYCKDLNHKKDKLYGSEPWICVRTNEVDQMLQTSAK